MRFQDLNVKQLQNRLRSGGQNVIAFEISRRNTHRLKREEVDQIAEKFRRDFLKKGDHGVLSVSLKYPQRWYSSHATDLHHEVNLFNLEDYNTHERDPGRYDKFRIYFIPQTTVDTGRT
jgi:intein-encoded DNA endonuclease-like protein